MYIPSSGLNPVHLKRFILTSGQGFVIPIKQILVVFYKRCNCLLLQFFVLIIPLSFVIKNSVTHPEFQHYMLIFVLARILSIDHLFVFLAFFIEELAEEPSESSADRAAGPLLCSSTSSSTVLKVATPLPLPLLPFGGIVKY